MQTMTGVVGLVAASTTVLVALAGQAQALTVALATLSGGTVTVSGNGAAGASNIKWQGHAVTVATSRGRFDFTTTAVPADCIGTVSDGVSTVDVLVAGCTPEPTPSQIGLLSTGQTTCWNVLGDVVTCSGTGQDGEIKAGVSFRYTSHDNGTISDHRTGLVWEKKTAANMFDAYTWDEAFEYVAGLNAAKFAGHDDWRLPNVRELQSIINYGYVEPAVSPEFNDCANGSCTVPGSYWSSTSALSSPILAWRVNFYDGFQLVGGKTFTIRVRAVRGGVTRSADGARGAE
jgi:uncharacterized protein DUF1566